MALAEAGIDSPSDETSGDDDAMPSVPADCPLAKLERKRYMQSRDLTVLIASWDLERGQGKTTLALRLAEALDRTDSGVTEQRASLSAEELTNAYTSEPAGASLVFDEAMAGVSNRRSMSSVNEAMRQIIGMGRVEEKRLFLTAPGVHQVDKDIRAMCDVWIFAQELGKGQMFRVKWNPMAEHELTHDWGTITWPGELPGHLSDVYEYLTAEKRRRLRGNGGEGEGFIDPEEARERAKQAREQAEQETRNELLRTIYEGADNLTQQDLADLVGLSRSRVGDIVTESSA